MESAIIDSLEDLGYNGELIDKEKLIAATAEGIKSIAFTQLIEWLSKQLASLNNLENSIRQISENNDADNFLMEVSGFLREFGCPYNCLVDGPINKRLSTGHNCLLLINYLTSELQATHILLVNKPNSIQSSQKLNSSDSTPAGMMRQLLITLGFPKPPDGITIFQLFSKVESKIKELMGNIEGAHMSAPLVKASLSAKQWESIQYINDALNVDTQLRKNMLQQRLDVTFQSFLWSDSAKKNEVQLKNMYEPLRAQLESFGNITIAHLLAAREDLLKVEKTSSGKSRDKTKCALNKLIIGKVPDRGGRTYELEPPPPEMPSFQQRSQGSTSNRGGGGGYRGRGGYNEDQNRGGGRSGYNENRSGGGRGGSDGGHSGGNWGQNQNYYQEQNNPGNAFFGGGGGQQMYGNYNATGFQQDGGYNPGGNYNQAGNQGGYRNDQQDGYRGRRPRRSRGYH